MTHQIAEIKGLDPAARSKLEAAHIMTVEDFLHETATPHQRTVLAKKIGVDEGQLIGWMNRADLMRLKGVGTEMANLLELCGVDSCKELQHRKAEHLHDKLKATNDAKKITHHAPTLSQVEEWIAEAKTLVAQPVKPLR